MRSAISLSARSVYLSRQDSAGFERGRLYSAPTRSSWRWVSSFLPTQLDVGSEQQYVSLEGAALGLYGLILMRRSVFPDRTRIRNSNSLIYDQNSLFRSPGNSREKVRKEAYLSTRWVACNDLKTPNSLYFPCLSANSASESSSHQTAPSANESMRTAFPASFRSSRTRNPRGSRQGEAFEQSSIAFPGEMALTAATGRRYQMRRTSL
jgi:hypothetical protein